MSLSTVYKSSTILTVPLKPETMKIICSTGVLDFVATSYFNSLTKLFLEEIVIFRVSSLKLEEK